MKVPPGASRGRGPGEQAFDDRQPVGAAEQRHRRFVVDARPAAGPARSVAARTGGFETIRSARTDSAFGRDPCARNGRGRRRRAVRAFAAATSSALVRDVGGDDPRIRPLRRERDRQASGAGADVDDRRRCPTGRIRSASSTISSVSGRGTSVAGVTAKSSPQNSRFPTIIATGSRRARRAIAVAKPEANPSGAGSRLWLSSRARSQPSTWRASTSASTAAASAVVNPARDQRAAGRRRCARADFMCEAGRSAVAGSFSADAFSFSD